MKKLPVKEFCNCGREISSRSKTKLCTNCRCNHCKICGDKFVFNNFNKKLKTCWSCLRKTRNDIENDRPSLA